MSLTLDAVLKALQDYPDFLINFVSVNTMEVKEPDFEQRVYKHLNNAKKKGFKGILGNGGRTIYAGTGPHCRSRCLF